MICERFHQMKTVMKRSGVRGNGAGRESGQMAAG